MSSYMDKDSYEITSRKPNYPFITSFEPGNNVIPVDSEFDKKYGTKRKPSESVRNHQKEDQIGHDGNVRKFHRKFK